MHCLIIQSHNTSLPQPTVECVCAKSLMVFAYHRCVRFLDLSRSHMFSYCFILGCGFFLSALSLLVAGGMEIIRKQELAASGGIVQELGNQKFNSSTLSMMLLVPQFGIFGISEIFATVAGRFCSLT